MAKTKRVYKLGLYIVKESEKGANIIKDNQPNIIFFVPIKFYPPNNMFFGIQPRYKLSCKKADGNIVIIVINRKKSITITKLPINELDFLVEKIKKIINELDLAQKINNFRIIFDNTKINFYCNLKKIEGQSFLSKFSLEISDLKNNNFLMLELEMETQIKKLVEVY